MKKILTSFLLISVIIFLGCDFAGPDEKAVREMVKTFVKALDKGDDDLANACLMNARAFRALNPSVSARSDAESFMADFFTDLIQSYRDLKEDYKGRKVEFKRFVLGDPFYQYKGFSSFQDNEVTIKVDGVEESFIIARVVRINSRWLIITLFD